MSRFSINALGAMNLALAVLVVAAGAVGLIGVMMMPPKTGQPAPSLALPCRVTEVYDGDTITVEVTIRARVRLLDVWAPELGEEGGEDARDYLDHWVNGENAVLYVPLDDVDRLDDAMTFGRMLGRLYVHGVNASEALIRNDHATREKPE